MNQVRSLPAPPCPSKLWVGLSSPTGLQLLRSLHFERLRRRPLPDDGTKLAEGGGGADPQP